jgi:integrase
MLATERAVPSASNIPVEETKQPIKSPPTSVDTLDKMHARVRASLKLSSEFVLHSLRHTMLTRLGESGADAFTIMRVAGHSTVVVSQRYVHPSPESVERAFERLEILNGKGSDEAQNEPKLLQAPTLSTTIASTT